MRDYRGEAGVCLTITVAVLLTALGGCSTRPPTLLNDFRQEITAPSPPARLAAGQTFLLNGVIVKNTGLQTWQARGNNQVELTYNWMTADGKFLQHGVVTILPANLSPGQSLPLVARIVAPENPGHYILRFTMIAEKIAWFSDMGGRFVDHPVEVVPQ